MKKAILIATVQSHICQFHRPLIEILINKGYEVHVAAKNNLSEKNGMILDQVHKVYDIPFSRSPLNKSNIQAYRELKHIFKSENYDIISCNTPVGSAVARLAAKKIDAKVFYMAHGFHFYRGAPLKNWIIYYPIEKFLSKYTDCLITITMEDYNLAIKKNFKANVRYLPGVGVNANRFLTVKQDVMESMKLKYNCKNKIIILCTGELNSNKNQKTVIQAISILKKKYANIILFIAGNGPLENDLKKMTIQLGVENDVCFLGYRIDIENYVCLSDIIVSVSYREGLPLNIIEAMTCSKSIIVSNNRGHRELIENGIDGILLKKNSYLELANGLIYLIKHKEIREVYEKNVFEKSKKYWKENVKINLEKIYFGDSNDK